MAILCVTCVKCYKQFTLNNGTTLREVSSINRSVLSVYFSSIPPWFKVDDRILYIYIAVTRNVYIIIWHIYYVPAFADTAQLSKFVSLKSVLRKRSINFFYHTDSFSFKHTCMHVLNSQVLWLRYGHAGVLGQGAEFLLQHNQSSRRDEW